MARISVAGRRKVPLVKMERYSNPEVTFSKRRAGLMKKGSELCTLTGAEMVIVVFSPGREAYAYAYGNPSVNAIIDRFLNEANAPQAATERLMQEHRVLNQRQIMFKLRQIDDLIDKENERMEEIDQERQRTEGKNWWEKPLDELTEEELSVLMTKVSICKDEAELEAQSLQEASGFDGFGVPSLMGTGSFDGQVFDPRGSSLPPSVEFPSSFDGPSVPMAFDQTTDQLNPDAPGPSTGGDWSFL